MPATVIAERIGWERSDTLAVVSFSSSSCQYRHLPPRPLTI